jgi:putative ABC transport system permease protein
MSWLWRDLRFAVRVLLKVPGHTTASVLALALGIGLTTATFSIVYGCLLRGLPFPEADRIMQLRNESPALDLHDNSVDLHDLADWRLRQRSFETLAAYDDGTVTLTAKGAAERLPGCSIDAELLRLLRVAPAMGRGITAADEAPGALPVVLLGWRVWKDRFDGDPAIVGRAVRLNGHATTVVGVMPDGFYFPGREEIFTPIDMDLQSKVRGQGLTAQVIGRLRPGVTTAQAQVEMAAVTKALAIEYPQTNSGLGVFIAPYLDIWVGKDNKTMLYTMLGAVLAVLLIACINVASLGMARAAQRTREVAIRTALGAGKARLVRQILTESVLLAAAGAVLGLLLARLGIGAFNGVIIDRDPPYWLKIMLDPAALLFTVAATLGAGLVAGLAPALHAARTNLNEVLKDEGRTASGLRLGWFTRTVVVAELAISCALLVGAGLMIKSVIKAQSVPLGFETRNILTFRVPLFPANMPSGADRAAFYSRLLDRLAAQPGVQAAGMVDPLPSNGSGLVRYAVDGRAYAHDNDHPVAHEAVVSPGLFATYHVALRAGRDFLRVDTATTQPVVIVNETLARKAWPGQNPIGKRLHLLQGDTVEGWRTVVGVVPDLKMDGLEDRRPEGFYLPLLQRGPERMNYVLRTAGAPLAQVAMARAEVAALDRDTPIYFVRDMNEVVASNRFFPKLFGALFSIFGLVALVLAAVGVYGVIALAVERRTQEIGVRMALGAGRRDVLAMLLGQGSLQLCVGLALGLPVAWGIGRLLSGVLFQVQPGDPAVFSLVVAMLALVALVATLVPSQRAMYVDPIVAIRYD